MKKAFDKRLGNFNHFSNYQLLEKASLPPCSCKNLLSVIGLHMYSAREEQILDVPSRGLRLS
jgi:hypothetical protein